MLLIPMGRYVKCWLLLIFLMGTVQNVSAQTTPMVLQRLDGSMNAEQMVEFETALRGS